MLRKILYLFVVYTLTSCVCIEKETSAMWEFVNNSQDTITIVFSDSIAGVQSPASLDSILLLPMTKFVFHSNDWGANSNYDCSWPFNETFIEYKLSGTRELVKKLHIVDNWSHESKSNNKCSNMEKCVFTITNSDIAK
jgi:hypothetical protein